MNVNFTPTQAAHPPTARALDITPGRVDEIESVGNSEKGRATDKRQTSNTTAVSGLTNVNEHDKIADSPQAKREALKDPNSNESRQLQGLKKRDREVRTHELAHLSAAGRHSRGGPSFEYERGPDGQRYAVGGHVEIDTSAVAGDPEATLRKAEVIRRAALAPANPSAQDRSVAASASGMAAEARREIAQLNLEETSARTNNPGSPGPQRPNHDDQLETKIRGTGAVGDISTTFSLAV